MTQAPAPGDQSTWRPRFQLGSLMLVMVVFCVMAAAGRHLVRAISSGTSPKAVFIIFAVAAPMVLLLAFSLVRAGLDWLGKSSGRH